MARILLIEDDEDIADNTILFLEHKTHQVVHVISAADGLEQMRYGSFDLIICDGHLPDMDGLAICKTYRDEGGSVPILMSSGRSNPDDKRRSQEVGITAYIVKPFTLEQLEQSVDSLIAAAKP